MKVQVIVLVVVIDHIAFTCSSPARAIGPVCVSVSVCLNEMTSGLDIWFSLTSSRSSSKVNVISQSSRSQEEKRNHFNYGCTLQADACILYRQRAAPNVHTTLTQFKTYCVFRVLCAKWSVRPRAKALYM